TLPLDSPLRISQQECALINRAGQKILQRSCPVKSGGGANADRTLQTCGISSIKLIQPKLAAKFEQVLSARVADAVNALGIIAPEKTGAGVTDVVKSSDGNRGQPAPCG